MANLRTYHAKRDFGKTAEPRGKAGRKKGSGYVIQKHDATRLHYDLRLELDGVMLSWAVTRGPSLVPGEKRLAIHVEDHPIEYNKFEGTIPKGQYGGGTVMVWDRGSWTPEHDPHKGMKKGHLDFELHGEKLQGPLASGAHAQAPGRTAGALAADQGDGRVRPQEIRPGHSRGNAGLRRHRPDHGRDRRATRKRSGTPTAAPDDQPKERAKAAAETPSAARQPAPNAAPEAGQAIRQKSSARSPARATAGCRTSSRRALATLSATAPDSGDWVHEIKFDGYRIQARIDGGKVTLKTRTGLDWTSKFPSIVEAACEALVRPRRHPRRRDRFDRRERRLRFLRLQDDLKNGRHDRMVYYVFDLLHLDGQDLTTAPLIERKRALAALLAELPKNGSSG